MAIKLADTLEPMADFPAARAEHINFSDGVSLQDKFNNNELGGGDSSSTITQEAYEALPDEEKLNGLYYCYDSQRIYKNGVQYGTSKPLELTYEEWKTLREAGAISDTQECIVAAGAAGILLSAEDIGYNNAESGIQATTVQGVIDNNSSRIATLETNMTTTYLIKDIAADGANEKTVSFKIRKDYFAAYYAKRTFLLSANIYSLGFSKPVIGLVEIFRSSADVYSGYVVNLQDTRYTGVTVTVNGDYLEVVVTFNSYESSGCMISCSSLSNVPIT